MKTKSVRIKATKIKITHILSYKQTDRQPDKRGYDGRRTRRRTDHTSLWRNV